MRYFAVSDVHGFLRETLEALRKAGYDPSDPGHFLVVCGDVFDRGPDPAGVMSYLRSLPQERLALVRGNHEDLMLEASAKELPEWHDLHNWTAGTVMSLAGKGGWGWSYAGSPFLSPETRGRCAREWAEALSSPAVQDMLEWLRSPAWKDFFETRAKVCVHAGVPAGDGWRSASREEWESARWRSPAEAMLGGEYGRVLAEGKGIVAGHVHTSAVFRALDPEGRLPGQPILISTPHGKAMSCPVYDDGRLACIDGCTAITGRANAYSWEE